MLSSRKRNVNQFVTPYFSFMGHELRNYIHRKTKSNIKTQGNILVDARRDKSSEDMSQVYYGTMDYEYPIIIQMPNLLLGYSNSYWNLMDHTTTCRIGLEKLDDTPFHINQFTFEFHEKSDVEVLQAILDYKVIAWVQDNNRTTLRPMVLPSFNNLYNVGLTGTTLLGTGKMKVSLPDRLPVIKRVEIEFNFPMGKRLALSDICVRGTHYSNKRYIYSIPKAITLPYNHKQTTHLAAAYINVLQSITESDEATSGWHKTAIDCATEVDTGNTTIDFNLDGYRIHPIDVYNLFHTNPFTKDQVKDDSFIGYYVHTADEAGLNTLPNKNDNTCITKINVDTDKYVSHVSIPSKYQSVLPSNITDSDSPRDSVGIHITTDNPNVDKLHPFSKINKLYLFNATAGLIYWNKDSNTVNSNDENKLPNLQVAMNAPLPFGRKEEDRIYVNRYIYHRYAMQYDYIYRNVAYIKTKDPNEYDYIVLGHYFCPSDKLSLASAIDENKYTDWFATLTKENRAYNEPLVDITRDRYDSLTSTEIETPETKILALMLRPVISGNKKMVDMTYNNKHREIDIDHISFNYPIDKDFRVLRTNWVMPYMTNNRGSHLGHNGLLTGKLIAR